MAIVLTAALTFTPIAHDIPTPCPDGMTQTWGMCVTDMARRWIPAAYLGKEAAHRNRTSGSDVAAPPPTGGVEQWRQLVAAYFPADQVDRALRIMKCESGGDPNAYNRSGASGLMQVLASWADNFGYRPVDLFDPDINLEISRYLWDDGERRVGNGWVHWVCR